MLHVAILKTWHSVKIQCTKFPIDCLACFLGLLLHSGYDWFLILDPLERCRKYQMCSIKLGFVINGGLWLIGGKEEFFRVLFYQDSPGTDPSSSSWIHSMKEKCNSRFSLDPLSMPPELSMTIDYGPPGVMQWSLHKRRVWPIRCHGLCTQLGSNLLLPHEPWADKTV